MKTIKFIIALLFIANIYSCDLLNDEDNALSESEIAEGLKSALIVGTDTSVTTVSKADGYFKDEVIKIFLPPEADVIYDNKDNVLFETIGLDDKLDDVILSINRAAENAANKAKPIFVSAITSMTIVDAMDILYGADTAATHYLRQNTYSELKTSFKPDMQDALNTDIVAGVSANDTWDELTSAYNDVANSWAGQIAGLTPVETELDDYVTGKALDGLFVKIAEEEKDIRKNPLARVNDILKKVFALLDN
ncbi:MAG: DUF4197 domain-containing protein [Bacteroidales bacterium]|nr:DUF4197 domain-containing protein [Bacteroidales bacterium]